MIGWLANAILITGGILLGHKWRHAFLLSMTGEGIWAINAAHLRMYDLATICSIAVIVAARNWFMWGRR